MATTYGDAEATDLDSAIGTLSIRDKTLLKRTINKHHNNNISAGYVPVHESSLNKTGLRGRKTYAFWTLVGLLSVLAWANMILTALIFQVLRLGHGLESLEIIPEQSLVKFFGISDLGKVYKPDGVIEGFREEPMWVEGDRGSLVFDVEDSKGRARNSMNLSHNGTSVTGVQSFEIKSRSQTIFSTDSPSFSLPQGVHNVETDRIESGRVTSGVNEKLTLRADVHAKLKGNEGTRVEGREIVWSADQVVSLESSNGSIILGGKNGILLDVKTIPIVGEAGHQLSAQYKVCVCLPQGKLFRVRVSPDHSSQTACHNVDQSHRNNPCV